MNQREVAETLALQAVSWLAGDALRLNDFLSETGASPASLVVDLRRPEFLAAVLDHILHEDARVLAFAEHQAIDPQSIVAARTQLPGGDLPHWT